MHITQTPMLDNTNYKFQLNMDSNLKSSKKLNGLITREVGVDHGKETDAYPGGVASYAK